MDPVHQSVERVQLKPWLLAVAVAALFVGLSGLWHFVSMFVFSPGDLGQSLTLLGDVLRDSWGTYLTYVVLASVAAWLLWQERLSSSAVDAWSIMWRAAVVYLPVALVVDGLIAAVWSILRDVPMFFFGFAVLG